MMDLAPGALTMIVLQLSAMRKNMLIQLYNNIYTILKLHKLNKLKVGFGYRTTGIATTPDCAGSYVRMCQKRSLYQVILI
jgi:hypothetical protein